MAFCKEYNAQTAKMAGDVVPVEITVYEVSGAQCCSFDSVEFNSATERIQVVRRMHNMLMSARPAC